MDMFSAIMGKSTGSYTKWTEIATKPVNMKLRADGIIIKSYNRTQSLVMDRL